jgi:CHAT domain-containing protein
LRNIPMSVLHDGQQYLIQKYAIALTPGLQLLAPQPLSEGSLKVLIGALSKAVNVEGTNFQALPGVEEEIKAIQADVPGSEILKNESFTNVAFAQKIKNLSFPVVHIATHGQFGSTAQDTYIVTYDQPINANQLSELLRNSSGSTRNAIELLIFSACETASGDARAALGLAGIAVRSGARSTIATLWQVNDESTAEFMDVLYDRLSQSNITKAEALRQAQKTLLEKPEFQHPFYWSPFVLIGNWL